MIMDTKSIKHKLEASSRNKKPVMISSEHFIDLGSSEDLPYLRAVKLVKYTPQDFGLEKWGSLFQIPDFMMRQIYRKDAYRDTDIPVEGIQPQTRGQKKILDQWLENHRKNYDIVEDGNQTKKRLRKPAIKDELFKLWGPSDGDKDCNQDNVDDENSDSRETLGSAATEILGGCCVNSNESMDSDDSNDSKYTISSFEAEEDQAEKDLFAPPRPKSKGKQMSRSSPNRVIAKRKPSDIAKGLHKIQPESVIIEQVIEKMKHLSPEEEKRYQDLLRDKEFMKILNSSIEKYLEENM